MKFKFSRRSFLGQGAIAVGAGFNSPIATSAERADSPFGYVVGEPTAEKVGQAILRDGGNAIDAVVAAALVAAVAAPNQTGIGGYGMSAIIALDSGRKTFAIDGNSTAPSATQADIFRSVADGSDTHKINEVGWLASGVPGILAGLQLAIDRFGTRNFNELVQPAIALARDGYPWPKQLASLIAGNKNLANDRGSQRLYFRNGQPLQAGETFTNPELAELLQSLADANSVKAFYQGDIAQRIADAFNKNGGLVTSQDLASYEAKLVEPLTMTWNDFQVQTPPLTAGGLTVLQVMRTLKAMAWNEMPSHFQQYHAKVEATRLAWNDRLSLLGDPNFAVIPTERLLSNAYAEESAARIAEVVEKESFMRFPIAAKSQKGTINLSAIDRSGNMAALTLTHGDSFGAKITVEGLGLTLGHGMSRFDPSPNHPNAPGPGKRPLHNMVPTIVSQNGQAVMAIGGRGGRKIVNAILDTLLSFVALDAPIARSIANPRTHTEGDHTLWVESTLDKDLVNAMTKIGYQVKVSASATLSAVGIENGRMQAAMR